MTYKDLLALIEAARAADVPVNTVMMRSTDAERMGDPLFLALALKQDYGMKVLFNSRVRAGEVLVFDDEGKIE